MVFIFWLCIAAVFYAYFGYTLVLWLITRFMSNKQPFLYAADFPTVSMIISAYNEEDVIEEKILNSLSLDYPSELLEIIVVSDGSTDKTDEIAARYSNEGILLQVYKGRIGKTECLNQAVLKCNGEIVVFSDANSKYDVNSIKNLVREFANPNVGLATGTTKYIGSGANIIYESVGFYTAIEKITKKYESKIASCVGADGTIFAVRRTLFQKLKEYDINDFVIPLDVIRKGYRVIFTENAFCIEKTAKDSIKDFKRQIRIANRTIRAIFNNIDILNPFRFGFFSFELFSHKLLKLIAPFFLFFFLFINIFLVKRGLIYDIILAGQILCYILAIIGRNNESSRKSSRLIFLIYTFISVNIAIFLGWITYFKGETYTTWPIMR